MKYIFDQYFSSVMRSPSTVRAGTREVHNKLEKNRRAHLKECFESLKRQLPITADEKKTSNLSILGAAIRHIQVPLNFYYIFTRIFEFNLTAVMEINFHIFFKFFFFLVFEAKGARI